MPLTSEQLQQFNNLIPRLSATQIIDMMKQHGVTIDQLPALQQPENAVKLEAIKNALETERHEADWKVLQDRLADPALSLQQAKQLLQKFISQWEHVALNPSHVAEAQQKLKELDQQEHDGKQQEHEADWQVLLQRLADPVQSLQAKQLLQQFISQWEHVALNPSHVAEAQQKLKELNQQEHEADWQQLFQKVNGQIQPEQAILALQQFIGKWQHVALNFSHVPEAQQKLKEFYKNLEEAEWQKLLAHQTVYDIPAYAAHVKKWRAFGIETHASEADDKAWDIVLNCSSDTDMMLKAIDEYIKAFPSGRHGNSATGAQSEWLEWQRVKRTNDLITVHKYITNHPNSLFVREARQLLDILKAAEIGKMQEEKDNYSVGRLNELFNYGIFTESELIAAGVATEGSIYKIRNLNWIGLLPDLKQVSDECKTCCADGRTDIYLFGTPSTGKTCVLMGLLKSSKIQADNVASAGEYVDALNLYCKYGCVPGTTKENFVATIQADIKVKGQNHEINLVELAGENFVTKIAKKKEGKIAFADMGKGVPELLANGNRKVFFFIVDPTSKTVRAKKTEVQYDANGDPYVNEYGEPLTQEKEYIIDQSNSLKAMANMLKNEANRKVMERVDAIHIIVTKADMLGEEDERIKNAEKLIRDLYSDTLAILTGICQSYGINQHPDKNRNGVPHLFTFSLGQFMPGGFEYDPHDSNELIDTIAKCTQSRRGTSLWDRFCQVLSKPVM